LIVIDPNILGLTEVLFHYNPRLNLFKGINGRLSVYPSAELVALRLLLLKKLRQREMLHIRAIAAHRSLLTDPEITPSEADLTALELTGPEVRLLQAVFSSEPHLFEYLYCSCLIDTLVEIGLVDEKTAIERTGTGFGKPQPRCRPDAAADSKAVRIAILPSLTAQFVPAPTDGPGYFAPTERLVRTIEKLKDDIRDSIYGHLERWTQNDIGSRAEAFVADHVIFLVEDSDPILVYPENADRMVRSVCPEADFTIVLLGEDVYLSLHIDPLRSIYPAKPLLYLDLADVQMAGGPGYVSAVGQFVVERLLEARSAGASHTAAVRRVFPLPAR
jgi:hypothetical protein